MHSLGMERITSSQYFIFTVFTLLCLLALTRIHLEFVDTGEAFSKSRDVYFIYQDASLLAEGTNPYSRIEDGDLTKNRKYTFYLPGFLLGAAASIKMGFNDYQSWMSAWLDVSIVLHGLIGLFLYLALLRSGSSLFALVGSSLWLFSRWPLALYRSGQIDAVAIIFFVLALVLLEKNLRAALLCFGVSLAIKQMAAFCLPIFLIYAWQNAPLLNRARHFSISMLYLIAIPFLMCLPFLIWDLVSFFKMLVFPLTRAPRGARAVDTFLQLGGLAGKLPFLAVLISLYVLAWKKSLKLYPLMFLTMMATLSFNAVFFSRYFCWAIPLIPLACMPLTQQKDNQPS
jgi:hypothetical protein